MLFTYFSLVFYQGVGGRVQIAPKNDNMLEIEKGGLIYIYIYIIYFIYIYIICPKIGATNPDSNPNTTFIYSPRLDATRYQREYWH